MSYQPLAGVRVLDLGILIPAALTSGKQPFTLHGRPRQALYDTYLSSDGVPVLLGALEHKFWKRFCEQIGRPDLAERHHRDPLASHRRARRRRAHAAAGVRREPRGDPARLAGVSGGRAILGLETPPYVPND